MSFDANHVYSISWNNAQASGGTAETPAEIERLLLNFILQYRVGEEFIYRDKLRGNLLLKEHLLEVDLRHVGLYNDELAFAIQERPADILPLFENAATTAARSILFPRVGGADAEAVKEAAELAISKIQITLCSGMNMLQFRDLTADRMNKLVRIPGIVISASVLSSRATKLHLQCRGCQSTKIIYPQAGLGGMGSGSDRGLPRVCDAPEPEGQKKDCPMDPYLIIHSKSSFADQQTLKLQEAPDMVPVGELPRHMLLSVDRYLCGKKADGPAALHKPYLRVVHLEFSSPAAGGAGSNPFGVQFTPEEEEEFGEMARSEGFYERFAKSVGPSIYGNLDIKKAVACLLFGGSKKVLPDGMRLRGDINVLLLGDPGTAKSQLLKFVEKVAPIAVYTSGKGSSAAGLTASVQRDSVSAKFYLEGGAMVLADTGVVCIDEFDKMRDEDRVAIHEAMEQQTISIAKAGITTVLNSRTSVLAAANPVFGRYDEGRSPGENIDFQTTILSRFDMIFIVKDEHNETRDKSIAKHVMNIHMNRATENAEQIPEGEISLEKMKRYIAYCKAKCAPRLSPDAQEMLSSHFVSLRKQVQQVERDNDERSSIPITVRQLEAIIRISESLAKMTLSPIVQNHHVEEAIRLFKYSTMDAVSAGSADGMSRGELSEEMTRIEKELRRRLPVGWSTSYQSLVKEFVNTQGYSSHALERTLFVLEKREVIRFSGQVSSDFTWSAEALADDNPLNRKKWCIAMTSNPNGFATPGFDFYNNDYAKLQQQFDFYSSQTGEVLAPHPDLFESELDSSLAGIDPLTLELLTVNNTDAFTLLRSETPTCGPPSTLTVSSESASAYDSLSSYSESFYSSTSPYSATNYSFPLDSLDMEFQRIDVASDYGANGSQLGVLDGVDPSAFGTMPPTPPRSPPSHGQNNGKVYNGRSSFSDYGPATRSVMPTDYYNSLSYATSINPAAVSPTHVTTQLPITPSSIPLAQPTDEVKADPRKKYSPMSAPTAHVAGPSAESTTLVVTSSVFIAMSRSAPRITPPRLRSLLALRRAPGPGVTLAVKVGLVVTPSVTATMSSKLTS
ncbi:minichromosome maintenance protein 5 [Paramarasmius palmivorus]|uniref:DNA helicase n=1 Tax=Paramarasmius palmivorus TaxID=297713 RepID=A0AAW0E3R4_9AGAR